MLLKERVSNKNYAGYILANPAGGDTNIHNSSIPPEVAAVTFMTRGVYYYVEVNDRVSFRMAREQLGRWLLVNLEIDTYHVRMTRTSDVRRNSSWVENITEIRNNQVFTTYISTRVARRLGMVM